MNEGWIGGVSASVTAQTGTVDTFAGALDAVGEQTFGNDWVKGRFNAVFGTSRVRSRQNNDEDTRIQDATALYGDWKHTIHERFFWQSGAEVSRDSVVDRMARASLATGPGYRLWQGENAALNYFDTRIGLGYRYELYDPDRSNAGAGQGLDQDHFADLAAGYAYRNLIFADRIDLTHTAQVRMPVNDPSAYVVAGEVILGIPLTPSWSFRTGVFVEYIARQPALVNNVTTRTTVGLGYTF
ncbi:DUF481 domain-containing protein [Myxococcota bacterium]|nr:DUF481 domain-containing protein [Myxococcota bacterium]